MSKQNKEFETKIEAQKNDELTKPMLHQDHKKPNTRREFLSQGFMSGVGLVAGPSLLGLLGGATSAHAVTLAECGVEATATVGNIPFIAFDLAGGASIAGSNVMVGGRGGQLDFLGETAYAKLGLPGDMTPDKPGFDVDLTLGLAFQPDSAFLRGIKSRASTATMANVNGSVFCAASENDTQNNMHNPMQAIAKLGGMGSLTATIGTRSSESGGRSEGIEIDPALRPVKVDRPSDATGMADTGRLLDSLSNTDAAELMGTIENMSALRIDKSAANAELQKHLNCSYVLTSDQISKFGDPAQLDPTMDPDLTAIISPAEMDESDFRKTASVMKVVVDGFAGSGTIEKGGYDYHNNTRSTGEVRDFRAGEMIGSVLEYAAVKGKRVMVYVFSDGSVSAANSVDDSVDGRGKFVWRGDNRTTASTFALVYNPNGRPQIMGATPEEQAIHQQIGHFKENGSLESNANRISGNVANNLAYAVALNWLSLSGNQGMFSSLLPDQPLGNDLDTYTSFQPLV